MSACSSALPHIEQSLALSHQPHDPLVRSQARDGCSQPVLVGHSSSPSTPAVCGKAQFCLSGADGCVAVGYHWIRMHYHVLIACRPLPSSPCSGLHLELFMASFQLVTSTMYNLCDVSAAARRVGPCFIVFHPKHPRPSTKYSAVCLVPPCAMCLSPRTDGSGTIHTSISMCVCAHVLGHLLFLLPLPDVFLAPLSLFSFSFLCFSLSLWPYGPS